MVSSLAHVLLVTPVIFFWLRARSLDPQLDARNAPAEADRAGQTFWTRKRAIGAGVVTGILLAIAAFSWWRTGGSPSTAAGSGHVIQQLKSGDLTVTVTSDTGRFTRVATCSPSTSDRPAPISPRMSATFSWRVP
jgi:hypothetical protein